MIRSLSRPFETESHERLAERWKMFLQVVSLRRRSKWFVEAHILIDSDVIILANNNTCLKKDRSGWENGSHSLIEYVLFTADKREKFSRAHEETIILYCWRETLSCSSFRCLHRELALEKSDHYNRWMRKRCLLILARRDERTAYTLKHLYWIRWAGSVTEASKEISLLLRKWENGAVQQTRRFSLRYENTFIATGSFLSVAQANATRELTISNKLMAMWAWSISKQSKSTLRALRRRDMLLSGDKTNKASVFFTLTSADVNCWTTSYSVYSACYRLDGRWNESNTGPEPEGCCSITSLVTLTDVTGMQGVSNGKRESFFLQIFSKEMFPNRFEDCSDASVNLEESIKYPLEFQLNSSSTRMKWCSLFFTVDTVLNLLISVRVSLHRSSVSYRWTKPISELDRRKQRALVRRRRQIPKRRRCCWKIANPKLKTMTSVMCKKSHRIYEIS